MLEVFWYCNFPIKTQHPKPAGIKCINLQSHNDHILSAIICLLVVPI
jgi:hypothetical protein